MLAFWATALGTCHGFSDEGYPAFSAEHVPAQVAEAIHACRRSIGLARKHRGVEGLSRCWSARRPGSLVLISWPA